MSLVIKHLEDLDPKFETSLKNCLRTLYDEVTVLPSAHKSLESGAIKNCIFQLNGIEPDLPIDIFSPNWFHGVSAIPLDARTVEKLLKDPTPRIQALEKLAAAIPSEMTSSDITVGPELDGDEHDRDTAPWVAGFDHPSSCVGIYSALQSRSVEGGNTGQNRAHQVYFLVCKAGGGLAAQTFHSRLCASLAAGKTLDECLTIPGNSPGPNALRRVTLAASRNRARILAMAARVLNLDEIDTLYDSASVETHPERCAVSPIDISINVLRKSDETSAHYIYTAGCVDGATSQGLMTASNVHEGFILFADTQQNFKLALRNGAFDTIPFVSERLMSNRETVTMAAEAHKKAVLEGNEAHGDARWIQDRFRWKQRESTLQLEPPCLWGSHASESWIARWGRELGVASYKFLHLAPELCVIASTEAARLRAAAKYVHG